MLTLIGGKWTTFRAFGEEVADAALAELDLNRTIDMRAVAIGGGRGFPADAAQRAEWMRQEAKAAGLTAARFKQLAARYGSRARDVARFIGEAPKPDGPLYHPYPCGASRDPAARAGWFGLAGWHGGSDVIRALFEGVAFAHLAHLARLEASGIDTTDITLSGGGAKSPVWPQMIADMLGRSVKAAAEKETGALGAAMAAAVGTGRYRDLDEAASAMVAPPRIVEPDPAIKDFYARRFALWQAVEASLAPHWAALRTLGDG